MVSNISRLRTFAAVEWNGIRERGFSFGFATPPSTRWRGLQPTGAPLCRRLRVMLAALGQDDAPARLSLVPKWKRCGPAACSAIVSALSLAVSPARQVCSPGPSWAISSFTIRSCPILILIDPYHFGPPPCPAKGSPEQDRGAANISCYIA